MQSSPIGHWQWHNVSIISNFIQLISHSPLPTNKGMQKEKGQTTSKCIQQSHTSILCASDSLADSNNYSFLTTSSFHTSWYIYLVRNWNIFGVLQRSPLYCFSFRKSNFNFGGQDLISAFGWYNLQNTGNFKRMNTKANVQYSKHTSDNSQCGSSLLKEGVAQGDLNVGILTLKCKNSLTFISQNRKKGEKMRIMPFSFLPHFF